MFLIGFAGDNPQAGIGVGGFLVILGIAFFVNSLFESRPDTLPPHAGGSNPAPAPGTRGPDPMPPT